MCSSCQSGRSQAVIDYLLYQTHAYCGARCGGKACLCRSQPARFESQLHTSCTLFFIITYFINSIPYIGLARGCSAVVTLALPGAWSFLGSKPVCGCRCLIFCKLQNSSLLFAISFLRDLPLRYIIFVRYRGFL